MIAVCGSGWAHCWSSGTVARLEMDVQHPGLLALDGPVDGIDPAEDAPTSHGVAAEGVHAWPLGVDTVGAPGTVADAEEVAQRQLYQGAEAVRAGQGILCQHGSSVVVGW